MAAAGGPPAPFSGETRHLTHRHREVYRVYEIAYTVVDFLAGLMFVIGSVMFFSPDWVDAGTWLFLFGSLLFVFRPTLRLLRELRFAQLPTPGDDARTGR